MAPALPVFAAKAAPTYASVIGRRPS